MLKSILAGSSAFREHGKFWTAAWSLVEGCTPVSPGCAHCWLSALEGRVGARAVEGAASIPSPLAPGGVFNGKIVCREDRLLLPLRARNPRVYSIWSDLGHEDVPFGFHALAHDVMRRSPQHHFLVITKRPESFLYAPGRFDPLPNVTILVTMEDQERVNERFPQAMSLVDLGWRVGALCEPLLGPISFRWAVGWPANAQYTAQRPSGSTNHLDALRRLSWVITGGESGHKARPAHPSWVRALRDQVKGGGLPFMFKQWGEWAPVDSEARRFTKPLLAGEGPVGDGLTGSRFGVPPNEVMWPVKKVGKAKAGRVLDGREWLEVP